MEGVGQLPIEDTFEHKFAVDLIRYVVETRMEGLNWIPTGVFAKNNLAEHLDSPFTPQMKAAVKEKLDRYENHYHSQYDDYFPDEIVTKQGHMEICRTLKSRFFSNTFSVKRFLTFCIVLAKFAGYSYLFGVSSAIEDAYKLIIKVVRYLKAKTIIDDNFWNAMQDFAENPDLIDEMPSNNRKGESTLMTDE